MTKEMVVRWVVATPEWVLNMDCDGPNCEIVPAKAYDRLSEENRKLRQIIADVMFREMNGLKPVLRTGDVAWAEIEPRSGEPPAEHPDTARLNWLERFGKDHGWTSDDGKQVLYIDEDFIAPLRDDIDQRIRADNRPAEQK